jgi:hypothetical protein
LIKHLTKFEFGPGTDVGKLFNLKAHERSFGPSLFSLVNVVCLVLTRFKMIVFYNVKPIFTISVENSVVMCILV